MTDSDSTAPYGYCHCGCGQKTRIAPKTSMRFGAVKGQPNRYIQGHMLAAYRPKLGTDKECEVCGDKFYTPRARPAACYCSLVCKGIASRKAFVCEVCGKVRQDGYRSRTKRWCSRECAAIGRRNGNEYACSQCGKATYRRAGYPIGKTGVFCSKSCHDKFQTYSPERMVYGSHWLTQRDKALARDGYTCQGCGIGALGATLHVHHIIPFKLWPNQHLANQEANLLVLCSSCHKRADLAFRGDGTVLFGAAPAG